MLNKKTLHYFSFNNPGHQSDSKFQAIHDLFVVFLRWVAMAPYVMIQGENRKLWHHWKKRKPFIPITKRESNKVNIQIHQPSSSSLWISQLMIFQLEIPKKNCQNLHMQRIYERLLKRRQRCKVEASQGPHGSRIQRPLELWSWVILRDFPFGLVICLKGFRRKSF